MRAVQYRRFGGPDVLEQMDIPVPNPAPGQLRVAMKAASVTPLDWKLRAGRLRELFPVDFPKIPGREGAGIVDALGASVVDFALGDEVYVNVLPTQSGTYAEMVVQDRDYIVRKPQNLDFIETAAVMHSGFCAWMALQHTAKVGVGTRLLVHGGAGAVGGAAIQLASSLGAEVTATCRAENVHYVRGLGAMSAIAYEKEDFTREYQSFDVVLDLIGGDVHDRSYCVLKPGGHLIYLIAGKVTNRSNEFGVRVSQVIIEESRAGLEEVAALADREIIRPQVCAVMDLARAAEAHSMLEAGQVSRGRLVLSIS